MVARLQRDIRSGPLGSVAGRPQSIHLRVGHAGLGVEPLPHDLRAQSTKLHSITIT